MWTSAASNDRGPEAVNPWCGANQTNRFNPAMIGRRCPVPPARRDGNGPRRSRFTSANLLGLPKRVLDLPSLRPWTTLLPSVLPLPGCSPATACGQRPPSAKPRGATRSSRPSTGVSSSASALAKKRDGSIFPTFRSPLQDAPSAGLSRPQLREKPFAMVLGLAAMRRLRPKGTIR